MRWLLLASQVVITDLKHRQWKYYFPCGQWLATDEGDGQILRDLLGSLDPMGVRKGQQTLLCSYLFATEILALLVRVSGTVLLSSCLRRDISKEQLKQLEEVGTHMSAKTHARKTQRGLRTQLR